MRELRNINTSFESYQKLIDLYQVYKDSIFEEIELDLYQWFAANMSSALGEYLTKLLKTLMRLHLKIFLKI